MSTGNHRQEDIYILALKMFIDSPLTSQAPYSLKGISYSQSMGRKDRHMSFIYLFEKLPSKNRWSNISAIGLCILISFFLYRYFLPQPRFSDQIFVFQQFLGNSFFSHLNIGNGRFAILGIKDLFFLPYLATGIEDATILMFALQTLYLLLFFIIFFYILYTIYSIYVYNIRNLYLFIKIKKSYIFLITFILNNLLYLFIKLHYFINKGFT